MRVFLNDKTAMSLAYFMKLIWSAFLYILFFSNNRLSLLRNKNSLKQNGLKSKRIEDPPQAYANEQFN